MQDDESLRIASEHGNTDTVRLLLEKGANIHADNDIALRYASMNGHTDTVILLLQKGANVHGEDD